MNPVRSLLSLAMATLLLSCGGGGGDHRGGVSGPTNLRSIPDAGARGFTLAWTPPTGLFDGYNLEAKTGDQAFERIHTGLLPPNYTSIWLTFSDGAPEDTEFSFRLNAAHGTQTSAYSNIVSVNSGLMSPGQPTGSYDWDRGGIVLTWSKNSAASTSFLLERADSDGYGYPSGSWTPLPIPDPQATSYLDTTVTLGAHYIYRVTNRKGAVSSSAGPVSSGVFAGLPAPGQPTATYDFQVGGMRVSWTRNTTANDGVKVERVQSDSYGTLVGTWTELTAPDPSATSYLDTTCAPDTYYAYRVFNLRNGLASAASSQSYPAFAGLLPPSYLYAYWSNSKNTVELGWSAGTSYDALKLERAVAGSDGQPAGAWTSLGTVPPWPSSFDDSTTAEYTSYIYRIAGVRGLMTSPSRSSSPVQTPLAAPVNLAVASTDEGGRLTWENRSTVASQLVVRRGPWNSSYGEDIAVLSASSASYADPVRALGYYRYWIVAKHGNSESASLPANYVTPNPADALTLSQVARAYPAAGDASLAPLGTWGLVSTSPYGMISNSDDWSPYFPGDRRWSPKRTVRMDAQGHPHLLYAVTDPGNSAYSLIRHAWHDGATWKTEDLGQIQASYYSDFIFEFVLDASGTPRLLVDAAGGGGSPGNMVYFHKVNGAWVREPVAGFLGLVSWIQRCQVSLDASGNPRILAVASGGVYECTRDPQGAWTLSLVAPAANPSGFLWSNWTDADNGLLLYTVAANSAPYGQVLMEVRKTAGIWQASTSVLQVDTYFPEIDVARSQDASRIAVACQDSYGLKLLHRDALGWHQTLVGPPTDSYSAWYRVGFDAAGKVHLLVKNVYPATGYLEFIEQEPAGAPRRPVSR